METIPILDNGRQVSHLAVRLDAPAEPSRFAFLYLHGLGSDHRLTDRKETLWG